MRGEVLHYDLEQGFGFITGADGARYSFAREDLRRDSPIGRGTPVEFQPSGGQARSVFAIRAQTGQQAAEPSGPAAAPPAHFGRNAVPAHSAAPALGLWSYFTRGMTANYVNFRDRARRKEYWGFVLFWTIAAIVLCVAGFAVDAALGRLQPNSDGPIVVIIIPALWILATFLPGLAVTIRRQHDIGLSGWFYLLMLLPYVGGLIIFVFTLIPSQMHENKWGAVPEGIAVPPPYQPAPKA
ncbi:MAG: DUF805 domain-containing protein [Rhizobiaceae bacterium]|nr:DUF805 domain-containing protein [Rhizobiaceae bacterium]